MKNPWVIIGIIAVILIGGSVWFSSNAAETYNEGVVVGEQIKGNKDAAVTLTEYADFQCPACAQFQPVIEEIMAAYGDQVRYEFKHFPLLQIHPLAESAARAAEAAGQQGKFFEFHDLLFINQATWSASPNPAGFFAQYAQEVGLDMDMFTRHQRSSLLREKIQSEFNEARELGLTGTPTFFLNGERMQIQTYEDFRTQIEVAIGVAPANTATSPTAPTVEFGI